MAIVGSVLKTSLTQAQVMEATLSGELGRLKLRKLTVTREEEIGKGPYEASIGVMTQCADDDRLRWKGACMIILSFTLAIVFM